MSPRMTRARAQQVRPLPPSETPAPPVAQRAVIAAKLRSAIDLCFAHWEAIPDVDFEAVFARFVEEAMAAQTRLDFDLSALKFLAALRNGHTGFSDGGLGRTYDRPLGFVAQPIDGQWVVTRSRYPELGAGSIIMTVDGEPVKDLFERCRPYIAASNERALAGALFAQRYLFPERFSVGLDDGCKAAVVRTDEAAPVPPIIALTQPRRGVALLGVRSFSDPAFEREAVQAVANHSSGDALIIDLRGNGGGSTPLDLLASVMDRPYRRWQSKTIRQTALTRAWGGPPEVVVFPPPEHEPMPSAFAGKVVLLVDGTCGSAAEDFIMPFKDNGRATLIGETTGGSSGQPFVVDLGDGMSARIGAKREEFPDGRTFEGVGIEPDIEVITTAQDIRRGHDPVLVAALNSI
jgi:carboxyl-terminal processing protease